MTQPVMFSADRPSAAMTGNKRIDSFTKHLPQTPARGRADRTLAGAELEYVAGKPGIDG
jgi:hypothetical protein